MATMHAVKSSNIAKLGWQAKTLHVLFVGGNVYEYSDVPREVFAQLLASDSIGRLFSQIVRGRYRHKKVDPVR